MGVKQELRKALDTTTASGGNSLLPYDLDPILNEELMKLQPLAELLDVVQSEGKTHEYNLRTAHPSGWFEGESTVPNAKNSTYARKSTMLKIQRIWGSVTGFAQVMDEPFINALTTELEGSLEGMSNVLEYGVLYGAADDKGFTGDPYQYSGVVASLAKDAPGNIIDAGGVKITLDFMDQAIAKIAGFRQTRNDPTLWLMGLRMKQVVDGLQTRIQMPINTAMFADGKITMSMYGKAPILETDYVVPSGTVSPAATGVAAAGGNLTAGSYTYRIASVTITGEQVAGTVSAGATADVTNKKVNLTWTADPNAKLYYIFQKKDAGAFQLADIIPALTYDTAGTVNGTVAACTIDGSKTCVAMTPLEVGEQNIFLLNRNPDRGVAFLGKVDDMGRQTGKLFTYVELARIKDTYDYMVKGYLGAMIKYPNVAATMIRRVKTA
jgi:hypothetical protein